MYVHVQLTIRIGDGNYIPHRNFLGGCIPMVDVYGCQNVDFATTEAWFSGSKPSDDGKGN